MLRENQFEVVSVGRSKAVDCVVDPLDFVNVHRVITLYRPSLIINLVALTNVDLCEADPNLAYLVNTKVPENITKSIELLDFKTHLVHISTDQIYDLPGASLESEINIQNFYSFSKYSAELSVSRVSSTILRTNFFGKSMCANRTSFSDWVVTALRRKQSIKVFEDVYFSPLSLNSLTEAILKVAMQPIEGVFNLGSSEGLNKAEFAIKLAMALGLHPEFLQVISIEEFSGLNAKRPKNMIMNSKKFEDVFGLKMQTTSQEIQIVKGDYI